MFVIIEFHCNFNSWAEIISSGEEAFFYLAIQIGDYNFGAVLGILIRLASFGKKIATKNVSRKYGHATF